MQVSGIILIAGSSSRYNKGYNKNLELINNRPIFMYSVEVMNRIKEINEIILVIKKEEENIIKDYIKDNNKVKIVYGGSSRKESVYKGLIKTNNDIVIIHDGARPLIKEEYLKDCLKYIKEYNGVVIGVPVKDTIKIIDENNIVIESTNRNSTWISQTPQCFKKDILLELHKKYLDDESITDDSILLEKEGIKVKMIKGSYTNIKLTTKEDLIYIKSLI